jgi:hypothetical protein
MRITIFYLPSSLAKIQFFAAEKRCFLQRDLVSIRENEPRFLWDIFVRCSQKKIEEKGREKSRNMRFVPSKFWSVLHGNFEITATRRFWIL